jgi:hypothetical protein
LEEELNTAMISFGEGHVTFDSSNEKKLIIEVSRIMLWYRKDFYKKDIGLVGIIYFSIKKGDEPENADVLLKYFDENEKIPEEMGLDKDGLMIWKEDFFRNLLKLKNKKKFKIKWKEYDWGTNSK